MSFAARASASADRLIQHFVYGSTITIRALTGSALSGGRGVTPTVTSATVACSTPQPFGAALRDGARVKDGDLRVYVWAADPNLTVTPAPDQIVELAGDSYRVVAVQKLVGAYELHLRGGGA